MVINKLLQEAFCRVSHAVLFRWLAHYLAEVKEALSRMELVGPQNQLAADVFGRMDGPIGVLSRLGLGEARPTQQGVTGLRPFGRGVFFPFDGSVQLVRRLALSASQSAAFLVFEFIRRVINDRPS